MDRIDLKLLAMALVGLMLLGILSIPAIYTDHRLLNSSSTPSGRNSGSTGQSGALGTGPSQLENSATISSPEIIGPSSTQPSASVGGMVVSNSVSPDFVLTASPLNVTVIVGILGNSTISAASLNGFAGSVGLAVTTNSTNLSCPSSLPSVSGSGNSTLSCSSSIGGNYNATVTATSGSLHHSVVVVYHVTASSDFSVGASPTGVSLDVNATGSAKVTVSAVNGFTGTITLTTNSSSTCTISPGTVSSSGSSTLSCTFRASTVDFVDVTGTNGTLSRSVLVAFIVQDFAVSASVSSVEVNAGLSGSSVVTVVFLNGFAGTISLVESNSSSPLSPGGGLTASLNVSSVTSSGGRSTLTLKTNAASFSGQNNNVGDYNVTVIGTSGPLSHSVTIAVHVGNFVILQRQSQITINETSSGSLPFALQSQNGFTGQVSVAGYACLLLPAKYGTACATLSTTLPTVTVSSSLVSLTPTLTVNITINVAVGGGVLPGLYGVGVNATVGSLFLVSAAQLTVNQPSITIVPSPNSVSVAPGVNATMTVVVTFEYGMSGTVTLSLLNISGASCTLAQSSVTRTTGDSASTSISCAGSFGSYNETIIGSGSAPYGSRISKTGYAVFKVVDFVLTPTPSGGPTLNAGQTGHVRIAISWPGSANGTVNLTVSGPNSLNASLSSTTLSGPGFVTLTVESSIAGIYQVVVNATTGPVVNGAMRVESFHSATLTVTVLSSGSNGDVFGLSPPVFYSAFGIILLAIISSAVYLRKRQKALKRRRRR